MCVISVGCMRTDVMLMRMLVANKLLLGKRYAQIGLRERVAQRIGSGIGIDFGIAGVYVIRIIRTVFRQIGNFKLPKNFLVLFFESRKVSRQCLMKLTC